MNASHYNRWLFILLMVSIGLNIFCASFAISGAQRLLNPPAAIHDRLVTATRDLPEPYRSNAQQQIDLFSEKNSALVEEVRHEHKIYVALLTQSPMDVEKTKAQAAKIRALTSELQEAMQTSMINILKDMPAEQQAKMVNEFQWIAR